MKPILFSKNATNFSSNGIGALDFLRCAIIEERNGIFELEGEITAESLHSSQLEMDSIIKAKVPDQTDMQLFRVYQIKKTIKDKYVINAHHVSYELSYIPSMPFSVAASDDACDDALQGLITNAAQTCNFTFTTDIEINKSWSIAVPTSIKNAIGGNQDSIISTFGGEAKWNNYSMQLLQHRGKTVAEKDVNLIYGKDIVDLTQEENISNVITGVAPYWKNSQGTLVTLPEKVIESSYASNYPFKRTVPLDCSSQFSSVPSQADLRAYAQDYVAQASLGIPAVSIKVKFVDLTGEDANNLKRLKLCDNVGILFVKLGINTTAKVIKYVYDVLQEEYDEITIGDQTSTLSSTIVDINNSVSASLATSLEDIAAATSWITGLNGNIVAVRGAGGVWKDILVMDTMDVSTAVNVIKIGQNGIEFSNNGIAGPFYPGFEIDGKLTAVSAILNNPNILQKNNGKYLKINDAAIEGGHYSGNTYTKSNDISLHQNMTYASDSYETLMLKASDGLYINAPDAFISSDNGVTISKLFTGTRGGYDYINGMMLD